MFQCEKKIIVDGLRAADHVCSRPDQLSTGDKVAEQSSEVHFRLKEVLRRIIQVLDVDEDADPLFFVFYEHNVREYRCPACGARHESLFFNYYRIFSFRQPKLLFNRDHGRFLELRSLEFQLFYQLREALFIVLMQITE